MKSKEGQELLFKYKGYRGLRYFRMFGISLKVIQVCLSTGKAKRGRANSIGVYMIDRMTFLSNYFIDEEDISVCTRREYNKAMKTVIELLT